MSILLYNIIAFSLLKSILYDVFEGLLSLCFSGLFLCFKSSQQWLYLVLLDRSYTLAVHVQRIGDQPICRIEICIHLILRSHISGIVIDPSSLLSFLFFRVINCLVSRKMLFNFFHVFSVHLIYYKKLL